MMSFFLRGLFGIVVAFSASSYGGSRIEDFRYNSTVAVNFSILVIADFAKEQTPPLLIPAKERGQSGSFIDHAGRRFVYVLFPEPSGNATYIVVSEICTGFGTATDEYHVSDLGISASSIEELEQGYRSMKADFTADLPSACPCTKEFTQP